MSVEAGLGVADLLQLLQQADETVDQSRVAAGKTGAAAAGAAADGAGGGAAAAEIDDLAQLAETAGAGAGEAGQTGAAGKTAVALRAADVRGVADDHERVKALAKALERAQVGQQLAFDDGQRLEDVTAAAELQQRLHEAEVEQRVRLIRVRTGKLPDERVGDADRQRAAGGEHLCQVRIGGGRQRAGFAAWSDCEPLVQKVRGVGGEQLRDELESLRADVERRNVQRFEVRAISRRVDDRRANRRLGRQLEPAVLGEFGVLVHPVAPIRELPVPTNRHRRANRASPPCG